MRSSKAWLYRWQPKKKTQELTSSDVSRIVRMLIELSPTLDSLYLIRDGLNSYLSVYDEMKEKTYD